MKDSFALEYEAKLWMQNAKIIFIKPMRYYPHYNEVQKTFLRTPTFAHRILTGRTEHDNAIKSKQERCQ